MIDSFSVQANNDEDVTLTIPHVDGFTLVGSTITLKVYEQEHAIPVADVEPILTYTTTDAEIEVVNPTAMEIVIHFARADTADLLRNYYFEVTIVDTDNNWITPVEGIMTVTQTENR